MNVKRMCFSLIGLLTLSVTMLSANQGNYQYGLTNEQVESCDLSPTGCASGSFFIRGDALYWVPHITGLELNFGTSEIIENEADATQVFATKEVDLDPHFKWSVGYRLGAGYEADKWKVGALWTHFNGNGKRSHHNEENIINVGKVNIKFDQIDLAFAYSCAFTSTLTFQPFIGVRAARIHEHIHAVSTTEIVSVSPILTALETRFFDDEQKYRGVGPLFGFQSDWKIGCGFGIYGTVAASLLYGDYSIRFNDVDIITSPISTQIFSANKRHVHAFDYNVDLAIGITWHMLIGEQWEINMKLGFEQHQYFNQNHLGVGRGDVSFTGGVFSIALGY